MEEKSIEAADIAKDLNLITDAQQDIKTMDVLVCGSCHEVSYFVEEFQEHKLPGKCSGVSNIRTACESEGKPQVWGFMLWKNKELQKVTEGELTPSSWAVYQRWCKLPLQEKNAWIYAGQTLQYATKIGGAKVNEVRSRSAERDPLALDGGIDKSAQTISTDGSSNITDVTANTSDLIKKGIIKPVKLNNDVTIHPSTKNGDSNKAYRTTKEITTNKQEYLVEKIVAKRFNPRRKTWEYKVKWENFDNESNTWEPLANLTNCKVMVDQFEEYLKKLRAEKAKAMTPSQPKARGRKPNSEKVLNASPFIDTTPGRPQRTSKQKALNQVKAWCGNISDADEGGTKRLFEDDDDSDDSFEKKMKMEDYSDDSDMEDKPNVSAKKLITKATNVSVVNNGVGKKLPQNVLIPDANGVVRINQKQLPSLSTGVYIMSKTAGIIKLDSNTSKVATSGGQTIVKVAPKIGQTQIKIVKKDGGTTSKIIQMSHKNSGTPTKVYKPMVAKIKKSEGAEKIIPKPVKAEEPIKPFPPPIDTDSDDGIEEMEFPTDLPLPEPDSPPGDFVLDPETGKIAGVEYPTEAPVVIKPEPPYPSETNLATSHANSLENIVSLAAADITEEDLKPQPTFTTDDEIEAKLKEVTEGISEPILPEIINNVTESEHIEPPKIIPSTSSNDGSILNKALTDSNIGPSPIIKHRVVHQRILNHSITSKGSTVVNPIIRKQTTVKPRFNIASTRTNLSEHVYSKANTPRRIGNTTISRAGSTPFKQKITNSNRAIPTKKYVINTAVPPESRKPKPVINMPSLINDEDLTPAPVQEEPTPTPIIEQPTEASTATTETSGTADLNSFALTDTENPIFITGDDGTVYQVAGQNEHGQTILITQGSDGQQQCLLVTNESTPEETQQAEEEANLTADIAAPVAQEEMKHEEAEGIEADPQDQVVAQVVRAEPPSPGGTHKVVVMLPDGNLMVTQVSPEEYASLELDS